MCIFDYCYIDITYRPNMKTKQSEDNNWITNLLVIVAVLFLLFEYNSCQERNIKARAYDIMEEESNIDPSEALEQAEYEHEESLDAMSENY